MPDVLRAPALLFVIAMAACSASRERRPDDDAAWRKEIADSRASIDSEWRTSPTSPLSAVDRRALRGPGPVHVEVRDDAVRLTDQASDSTALTFRADGPDRWSWERGPGEVTAAEGDRPLAPGPVAGPAVFRLGRFSLLARPQNGELVVMIHDANRAELRQFQGLSYFAPDRRYAVEAVIERSPGAELVTIPTTRKLEKSYHRYGRLRFTVNGQAGALTAYQPVGASPGSLFVLFRDATSGGSTYAGGRYLDIDESAGDTIQLDFNRAYNPMCVYSAAYNCPIPPPENKLGIAIEAGQKIDAH